MPGQGLLALFLVIDLLLLGSGYYLYRHSQQTRYLVGLFLGLLLLVLLAVLLAVTVIL